MRKITLVCVAAMFLIACSSEEIKTVDWYKQHEKERNEMVKKCKNDHSLDGSVNCKNAISAKASMNVKDLLGGF